MMISDEITKEPQAGKSVMLTIDSNFQNMVERIVQYHMDFLHSPYYTTAMDANLRGKDNRGRLRSRAGRQGRLGAGDGDPPELAI